MEYVDPKIVLVRYDLPLNEIIFDFHDRLKSMTRGYGSLDYEFADYRESDLVKLDIMVNGDPVDALSLIVHTDKAYDLEVDTSATSANECAMQIAVWLCQSPAVDAFTQLRATHASPVPKPCT